LRRDNRRLDAFNGAFEPPARNVVLLAIETDGVKLIAGGREKYHADIPLPVAGMVRRRLRKAGDARDLAGNYERARGDVAGSRVDALNNLVGG
jgi:hypothetical protein